MSVYHLPLRDSVFVTSQQALIFPDNDREGEVPSPLRTTNGGDTWEKMPPETTKFKAVSFLDANRGWAASADSKLWKTSDGGSSWAEVSELVSNGSPFTPLAIQFTDDQEGWCLDPFTLWHTQDGGQTWEMRQFPTGLRLFRFYDRNNGLVGGGNTTGEKPQVIYRTQDSGQTWEEITIPNSNSASDDIQDVFFLNEQQGWLADYRGIYHTNDGGATWEKQKLPQEADVRQLYIASGIVISSICFVSGQEGWAAGMRLSGKDRSRTAILLHTSDGGDLWHLVDTKIKGQKFSKVFFGDAKNGWLVGEIIIGEDEKDRTNVYHTEDGGQTWKSALSIKSPYAQ